MVTKHHMYRHLNLILAVLLLLPFSYSRAQVDTKVIRDQALESSRALVKNDYETIVKFTYPSILKQLGGRDSMVSMLEIEKMNMALKGMTIESVHVGEPFGVVEAGDELHTLVPQTLLMKVSGGTLKSETHLLAISQDGGNRWYFADTSMLTMDNVRRYFPNYNMALKIPAKKAPELIRATQE